MIGPTVDDLVAALDAQTNTDMSPAVDVEVGGFAGKRVTMKRAEVLTSPLGEECGVVGPVEGVTYFVIPGGGPGRELQRFSLDTLWIIDVDGQRVVIATGQRDPGDTEATTTIAGVIDSIEFVLP